MQVFPVEIIQEILAYLRPPISTTRADEVNHKVQYDAWNWWSPRPAFSSLEASRLSHELLLEEYYLGGEYASSRRDNNPRQRYIDILPLRLVNKTFRDICTPFVYQEMTLFDWTEDATSYVANHYGRHVRSLRIMAATNSRARSKCPDPEDDLLRIISLCPEIRSIAFYYLTSHLFGRSHFYPTKVMSAVLQLRRLNGISIYTTQTFGYPEADNLPCELTEQQIEAIAGSGRATSITHLDISISELSSKTYKVLLSRYTSLEHLSLFEKLSVLGEHGSGELDWSSFRHLTSLSIAGGQYGTPIFSGSIPDLVRTCPSLRRLCLSDHGTLTNPIMHGRPRGWSRDQDDWWNRRTPLEYFQLEVGTPETMLHIGSIPTQRFFRTYKV
ncbi:hypothetical protein CPB86DRAFT_816291 [Serendipita vermifera]|nr:hypothetical protein CPB86DRAFT_816291 [Serendipita vermifera]